MRGGKMTLYLRPRSYFLANPERFAGSRVRSYILAEFRRVAITANVVIKRV